MQVTQDYATCNLRIVQPSLDNPVPSPGTILLSLVVAFIPALGYTLLVWWLDRYEREPFRLLVVAFFWGAVPAIALAILLEYRLGDPFAALEPVLLREFGMDSLVVPVIEELTKGLALLLLFLLVRNEFDNVLDGIVYGAVIGFGFAMTENALYFIDLLRKGGADQFTNVVMLRLLLFGLNHAFYSAIVGAGFGLAAEVTGPMRRLALAVSLAGSATCHRLPCGAQLGYGPGGNQPRGAAHRHPRQLGRRVSTRGHRSPGLAGGAPMDRDRTLAGGWHDAHA